MKVGTVFVVVAIAAGAIGLSGCVTPESRIRENPETFARLSAQEQALVKAGQVGVGFSEEAVRLAVGDPDRVTLVSDSKGQFQVWHYVTYETPDGILLYSGYYHRGPWGFGAYPFYDDYPMRRPRDFIKVVFGTDRKVVSVEQDLP